MWWQTIVGVLLFGPVLLAQSVYELDLSDPATFSYDCGKHNPSHWTVSNDSCELHTTPIFMSSLCLQNDSIITIPVTIRINQSGTFPCDEHAYFDYYTDGIWHPLDTILGCEATSNRSYSYEIPIPDSSYFSIRITYETDAPTRDYQLFDGDIKIFDPCFSLLPLDLISFNGYAELTGHAIQAKMAPLQPSEDVTLEYSVDGVHFTASQADVQRAEQDGYLHIHWFNEYPIEKMLYYRLHLNNGDGGHEYSPIICVDGAPAMPKPLIIFPNPATRIITVRWESGQQGIGDVLIFNTEHQIQLVEKIEIDKGFNSLQLDLDTLIDGWYTLQLTMLDQVYRAPFILQTY